MGVQAEGIDGVVQENRHFPAKHSIASTTREFTLKYSIVIPVYNEEQVLPELHRQIADLLDSLDGDSEVVLVDDGSTDNSYAMLVEIHRRDPRFKIVRFSRNFGHQVAVSAGIEIAEGDAVVIMDADLQDPPDVVLRMAEKWREGYEIVYGVRTERNGESRLMTFGRRLFYRALRRLADVDIPADVGDFRLVDRRAVDTFKLMRESNRYVRGMFGWMGFRHTAVEYVRAPRFAGKTHYPLKKLIRLGMDGVFGFSRVPLRIALKVGGFVAVVSLLGGLAAIIARLVLSFTVPGWASMTVLVSFLGGIQLAVLGMMGEYIGRTYEEVLNRPLYIISDAHGVSPAQLQIPRTVVAAPRVIELDPPAVETVRQVTGRR